MALAIRINHAVLKWVMDNEGWSADELAAESGLSASQVQRWTSAESDISISDLRRMSKNFKRPMSVLFMGEAPAVTIPSLRRGGGGDRGPTRLSRGALDVIREARYVQGNAAEMLRSMGRSQNSGVSRATTSQSPESAAAESAADLGIRPPLRTGSGEDMDRDRYNDVRERIESRGVFTMQAAIPADGCMSGLALAEPAPAVILVNSRDTLRRRIFALLHEYAHIALNEAGVACAAADEHGGADAPGGSGGAAQDAERWCSRFAGAVLMPRGEFLGALEGAREEAGDKSPLKVAGILSDRFCVSRAAALARAVEVLGGDDAAARYSLCHGQAGRGPDGNGRDGGKDAVRLPRAAACMSRRGRGYARLALDARESGIITTSTLLEYIGIKLGHLDDLRERCGAARCAGMSSTPPPLSSSRSSTRKRGIQRCGKASTR